MARTLMIQGTSSNVGKSLLSAAFCRYFYRKGINVVPFKAQNMALNSYVTPEGHEIGRAQAVQAQAACAAPHVDMNPVLLKPEADSRSQVVLMGKPWHSLPAADYYAMKEQMWSAVCESLERLGNRHELIIIEGAGSPAEMNLKQNDIVNMSVARHLQAPVLLAGDIDRGGIFAQLYGTIQLLEPEERELVKGFLINKFRGDINLFSTGAGILEELTGGIPTLGVIPFIPDVLLAQEDSVFLDEIRSVETDPSRNQLDIAVICLPHMSNYDDFDPLLNEDGVRLRFIESVKDFGAPDALIIPGSKTTVHDLLWLENSGIADFIRGLAKASVPVFGICGGYQMLGQVIEDPDGIEGQPGRFGGLGLLPARTVFSRGKETAVCTGEICATGEKISGYEIHSGLTELEDGAEPLLKKADGSYDGCISGSVCGTYFHGIFDNDVFRRVWLKSLGWKGQGGASFSLKREEEFERIADTIEASVDMNMLEGIIGF